MKRILFGVIVLLIFLAACQKAPEIAEEVDDKPKIIEELPEVPEPSGEPIDYTNLFDYSTVSEYTYKATVGDSVATTTTSVEDTTYEGAAAYKLTNELVFDGGKSTTTMYISKNTHACIALMVTALVGHEDTFEQEIPCPEEGLNSQSSSNYPVERVGEDEVTVPAGTFTATEYVSENVHYWIASETPLPVKYSSEYFEMVLVSFK